MAQVDFTNAVLDNYNGSKPLTRGDYLNLDSDMYFYDQGGSIIATYTRTIILNTPAKVSILFSGTFSGSGTSFHNNNSIWGVSNISFSNGDTFSFVIDIEVSGNT